MEKSNKTIVGLIIAAIVIIGIVLATKPPASTPTSTTNKEAVVTPKTSAPTSGTTKTTPKVQPRTQTQSSTIPEIGPKPATVQVNYTDTGFMPPALQIKIGQTVRFLNDSSSGMWVASGPHPTHTGYPGFDEGQIVFRGSIYEFTFDKLGTWSYHNHINETKMGTIIVK